MADRDLLTFSSGYCLSKDLLFCFSNQTANYLKTQEYIFGFKVLIKCLSHYEALTFNYLVIRHA